MATKSKKKNNKKEEEEQLNRIHTILTRIDRSSSTNKGNKYDDVKKGNKDKYDEEMIVLEPPDETNALLGDQLALSFTSWLDSILMSSNVQDDKDEAEVLKKVQELGVEMINSLSQEGVNSTLSYSFFTSLSSYYQKNHKKGEETDWCNSIRILTKAWSIWILHCKDLLLSEEKQSRRQYCGYYTSQCLDALTACINGYVSLTHHFTLLLLQEQQQDDQNNNSSNNDFIPTMIAETFTKLHHLHVRNQYLKDCITACFHSSSSSLSLFFNNKNSVICYLSPLLTSLSSSSTTTDEEISLFLRGMIRECSTLLFSNTLLNARTITTVSNVLDVLLWLLQSYHRFILITSTKTSTTVATKIKKQEQVYTDRETLYQCILSLMDVISLAATPLLQHNAAITSKDDDLDYKVQHLRGQFNHILDTAMLQILPFFGNNQNSYFCRFSIQPILKQLLSIVNVLRCSNSNSKEESVMVEVSVVSLFQLSVTSLHTPDLKEREMLLQLFHSFCFVDGDNGETDNVNEANEELFVKGLIFSLGSIFGRNATSTSRDHDDDDNYGEKLYQSVLKMAPSSTTPSVRKTSSQFQDDNSHCNLIKLFANFSDDQDTMMHLVQCITYSKEVEKEQHQRQLQQLTPWNQCAALLIGSFLLYSTATTGSTKNTCDTQNYQKKVFGYLRGLLEQHPHLCRRFIPIITTLVQVLLLKVRNNSSENDDDNRLILTLLEFTCTTTSKDPNSAQEVWTLLSNFTNSPHAPLFIKCTCIRLYPLLIKNNKRFYNRVRDSLGDVISMCDRISLSDAISSSLLYIAVSATICDLAEEDLIRDVTDVVGWIQHFLSLNCISVDDSFENNSSNNNLVVYYALMSLHYFIRAGELDFASVCKVLKKRLVDINDVDEVLKLDENVLEALVMLLGDGQHQEEEKNVAMEEETDDDVEMVVQPQVASAVTLLIELALSPKLVEKYDGDTMAQETSSCYTEGSKNRILSAIYKSLSAYSSFNLGIDAEAIRSSVSKSSTVSMEGTAASEGTSSASTQEVVRYQALKRLVMTGLNRNLQPSSLRSINADGVGDDDDNNDGDDTVETTITDLASKLIQFEEDTLGLSLWSKKTHKTLSSPSAATTVSTQARTKASKATLSALPDAKIIHEFYHGNPCTATATSVLLCLNVDSSTKKNSTQDILDKIFEVANDIQNDTSDPVLCPIVTSSWIVAMRKLWMSIEQSDDYTIDDIIEQIRDWSYTFCEADNAYVALAALALSIPERHNDADMTHAIDTIYNAILDAYNSHSFESEDIANITLGLIAVRLTKNASIDLVDIITGILENTLKNGTGKQCFGAMFGLGMISQSLFILGQNVASLNSVSSSRIQRVISVLLEEFHAILPERVPALLNLVACVKSGKSTSDLVKLCRQIDDSSLCIHDSKRKKFKSLCIALALSLPSLRQISADLLLGTYVILDKCPWGSGKGYVLPAVLRSCSISGTLGQQEVEEALSKSSLAVESTIKELDDALFAMTEFSNLISFPKSKKDDIMLEKLWRILRRDSKEGNIGLDSRASANLAACALVGSIPALGDGLSLLDSSHLHPETRKERVIVVAKLLIETATSEEDIKCCDAATIGVGLLCSMKKPVLHNFVSSSNIPDTVTKSLGKSGSGMEGRQVDVRSIPNAKEGTLVNKVISELKSCLDRSTKSSISYISLFLRCLHGISLPGPFAKIINTLLSGRQEGGNMLKIPCIELLSSQIKDRQRSGLDGQDFINVILNISKLSVPAFHSLIGRGTQAAEMFMSLIEYALPKFPSGTIDQATKHLWSICHDELSEVGFARCSIALISSFGKILQRAQKTTMKKVRSVDLIAPVTVKMLQEIIVDTIFPALCTTIKVPGMQIVRHTSSDDSQSGIGYFSSIWSVYTSCLCEVPISVLRDKKFFLFDDCIRIDHLSTNIAKTYAVSSFEENTLSKAKLSIERSKAQAWISRQKCLASGGAEVASAQLYSMRLSLFDLAHATARDSSEAKIETILHAFEVLLVSGLNLLCLEQLAIQVGFWWEYCKSDVGGVADYGALSHLSSLFARSSCKQHDFAYLAPDTIMNIISLFLRDLPWKLSHVCAHLGISTNVSNKCLRIIAENSNKVASHHLPTNEYLECLKAIVLCSMDGKDSNQ